jgi:hypothetical protein
MNMAKKLIVTIAAAAILLAPGAAANAAAARSSEVGEVVIGTAKLFDSAVLGGPVTYYEHLPADYATGGRNYPLVLQLDAQDTASFAVAAGTLDRLGIERTPPMILIGLANTGPAAAISPRPKDGDETAAAGVFLEFLEREFLPHLVRTYRTESYRILFGESRTGLFAVYAFLARPDLFQAFVAASPTLDCLDVLRKTAPSTGMAGARPASLFVFHGGFDDPDLVAGRMPALKAVLDPLSRSGLRGYVRLVERAGCVPVACLNDALLELFHDFVAPQEVRSRGVEAVDAYYRALSERYGFPIQAPEEVYFQLGMTRRSEGRLDEATAAFAALVARYPDSARGRAFLGMARRELSAAEPAWRAVQKGYERCPAPAASKKGPREPDEEEAWDAETAQAAAPSAPTDYPEFRKRIGELYQQKKYTEAAELLERGLDLYPDRVLANTYNLALMRVSMGKPDRAVEALEEGHRRGVFYGKWDFEGDPWAPLRDAPGFPAFAARNAALIDEAGRKAVLKVEVRTPEGYDPSRKWPLFIALHGGGETVADFMPSWTSPALRSEFIVAYVQSTQVASMRGFHWQDDDIARRDLAEAYRRVLAGYPVDADKVIIGGFSSGGYGSLVAAFEAGLPVRGFVALCPEVPKSLSDAAIAAAKKRGLRGTLLTTELDRRVEQQRALAERWKAAGLDCAFDVTPDIGHWYPKDFEARLDAALARLKSRDR